MCTPDFESFKRGESMLQSNWGYHGFNKTLIGLAKLWQSKNFYLKRARSTSQLRSKKKKRSGYSIRKKVPFEYYKQKQKIGAKGISFTTCRTWRKATYPINVVDVATIVAVERNPMISEIE